MTRWARGVKSNKKKEHDASSWQEIKSSCSTTGSLKKVEESGVNSFYTAGTKNKNRKPVCRFRLQEKNKFELFDSEESSHEESDDNTIVFRGPADDRKPGIASELEELGVHHASSDTRNSAVKKQGVGKESKSKKKRKAPKDVVKTELSKKLNKLKSEQGLKKTDVEEIDDVIRKDQRREKRRLKRKEQRMDSKMCFNCRKKGHTMEECTEKNHGAADGICYKCGSTEHSMHKCKAKVPPGHFPYAKCFICGEQGHLSSMCQDNPRGLYPKGGCCRVCGSVEHFKKDCPEHQKQSGIEEYVATRLLPSGSVDDDSFLIKKSETVKPPTRKKPKIVKF